MAFVDADDIINSKALEIISLEIILRNIDFALPRIKVFSDTNTTYYDFDFARNKLLEKPYFITNLAKTPELLDTETSMCMKIFNGKFIRDKKIRFSDVFFCEDVYPSFRAVINAKKILLIDIDYYFYRLDRAGQRTSLINESTMDLLSVIRSSIDEIKNNLNISEAIPIIILRILKMFLWGIKLCPIDKKDIFITNGIEILKQLDKLELKKVKNRVEQFSSEWFILDAIVFNYSNFIIKNIPFIKKGIWNIALYNLINARVYLSKKTRMIVRKK